MCCVIGHQLCMTLNHCGLIFTFNSLVFLLCLYFTEFLLTTSQKTWVIYFVALLSSLTVFFRGKPIQKPSDFKAFAEDKFRSEYPYMEVEAILIGEFNILSLYNQIDTTLQVVIDNSEFLAKVSSTGVDASSVDHVTSGHKYTYTVNLTQIFPDCLRSLPGFWSVFELVAHQYEFATYNSYTKTLRYTEK